MANLPVKDASGTTVYIGATGDGSGGDPYIAAHSLNGVVPGTGATSLGKAEDAAHASGDVGVMALGVRKDAAAATAGSDGDYQPLISDASGHLYVNASGAAVPVTDNAGSLTVDNNGTFAVQAVDAGDVAHDGADSGNPVKVGGKAISAEVTAVSAADRTNLITDLHGKLITLPYANPENFFVGVQAADMTDTSSHAVKAAHGSLRYYITAITVSNLHATVDTRVDILDGSTVIWSGPAAHLGGGFTQSFPVPLVGTAATAINAQNATTGAAVRVSVSGYVGA